MSPILAMRLKKAGLWPYRAVADRDGKVSIRPIVYCVRELPGTWRMRPKTVAS